MKQNTIQHIYSQEFPVCGFRAAVINGGSRDGKDRRREERGQEGLAAFQGSDTLGSVSNVWRDYSKSADKQGHERKQQKVPA